MFRSIVKLYNEKRTGAKIEAHASEKLVARYPVVVPNCELKTSIGEFLKTDIFIYESVIPNRGTSRSPNDRCLLFARTPLVRKQITVTLSSYTFIVI